MWWLGASICPGELRAPCGGSPSAPTDKYECGFRDRPCDPPGECGPFLRNSKEPPTPWHGCHWHRATSTCLAAHEGRMLHSLPCQGSSSRPSRERAAANTPLFTKYSWIMALRAHQGRQQILTKAKGICSSLPLSARGVEGPLLLCPCCRGRAIPPAGLHGAYCGMWLLHPGPSVPGSPAQD